ncbi:carboxymuconolactone decarboxylase family protein [Nonomuraea sp. 10N515B]|uniref:carboxymuconolactone decarboxylase family protein n=1 Tax=Nonomuraea sp. 10N515B TaxID=3457422 RepID=UPI003FCE4542
MMYLPSLAENATLLDVFRAYPDTARPLLDYHQALMRGPSPLEVAERELIAAYVSALNACGYCHGIHSKVAESFGVGQDTLAAALDDLETAPVAEKMRPVLRYARKLTLTPSRITPEDASAVLEAGWAERALHDVVAVCALFNFANRFVDGLGVTAGPDYLAMSAQRLTSIGYAGLKDML